LTVSCQGKEKKENHQEQISLPISKSEGQVKISDFTLRELISNIDKASSFGYIGKLVSEEDNVDEKVFFNWYIDFLST
jgi:hypothetical protein